MTLPFADSAQSTLGIEWELALVDAVSGELRSEAPDLLRALHVAEGLADDDVNPHMTSELLQNTVELVTGVHERVDESQFRLIRPGDILQGAVRPVVRDDYRVLDSGTIVLAAGDGHATVDPVTGQGANSASFEAQVIADAIIEDGVLDERFAKKVAMRRKERVDGTSAWVNTMIQTPTPDHVVQLLGAMSQIPTLCDEFTDNFSHPHRNADLMASPERVAAAIARHAALGRVPETAGAA